MKRKILTILLLGIISSSIVGCTSTEKRVQKAIDSGDIINMVPVDVYFNIGDITYQSYYDPDTKLVYIAAGTYQKSGAVYYLGPDKQPMKLDEFLKLHGKQGVK